MAMYVLSIVTETVGEQVYIKELSLQLIFTLFNSSLADLLLLFFLL